MFKMSFCQLDGQWNHDPQFEDHFVGDVTFGISLVAGAQHIPPLFYLSLELTQYSMSGYMYVPSTPLSSPSRSSSSTSSMVEEIFTQLIMRECISSLDSEIPLSTYQPYDPLMRNGFLFLGRPLIVDDVSDEEEDPFEDVRETLD